MRDIRQKISSMNDFILIKDPNWKVVKGMGHDYFELLRGARRIDFLLDLVNSKNEKGLYVAASAMEILQELDELHIDEDYIIPLLNSSIASTLARGALLAAENKIFTSDVRSKLEDLCSPVYEDVVRSAAKFALKEAEAFQ